MSWIDYTKKAKSQKRSTEPPSSQTPTIPPVEVRKQHAKEAGEAAVASARQMAGKQVEY